jgi:hypothetical protein
MANSAVNKMSVMLERKCVSLEFVNNTKGFVKTSKKGRLQVLHRTYLAYVIGNGYSEQSIVWPTSYQKSMKFFFL